MEEKDTPEIKARLNNVVLLLEDFLADEDIQGIPNNLYIKEALEILLELPFFAKHK